jgi:citrate lyase beta subunit
MLRINPVGTEEGMRDVLAIIEAKRPPPALMMTKVKAGAEVAMLDQWLGEKHAHVRLHVIIETNQGLENAYAIGQASGRIDALLFGGYDMSAELRVEPQWEALFYARARVVHAAAAAGVDVIDVPHLDLDDGDGLATAARRARQLGFTGKAAIHPKQIGIINAAFSPSEAQIAEAGRIVAAFEEGGGSGLLMVDGKLIEAPVLRSMQRILAVAERLGGDGLLHRSVD